MKKNKNFIDLCFSLKIFKWFEPTYKKNREIISYLIVGGMTTLVSLIIYYSCVFTFLNPLNPFELQIANVISWVVSVAFAYVTNRILVFNSKNKNIFREIISFVGSRVITLLLDMFGMYLLVSYLGFNDKICKIVVQVLVIVANYILSKIFVFKKSDL